MHSLQMVHSRCGGRLAHAPTNGCSGAQLTFVCSAAVPPGQGPRAIRADDQLELLRGGAPLPKGGRVSGSGFRQLHFLWWCAATAAWCTGGSLLLRGWTACIGTVCNVTRLCLPGAGGGRRRKGPGAQGSPGENSAVAHLLLFVSDAAVQCAYQQGQHRFKVQRRSGAHVAACM